MATAATAPTVIESKMYIAVDPIANNNKFWKYERYSVPITENGETGDLKITWGRVGAENPESQLKMYNEKWLASKIKSKLRGKHDGPPYTEAQVMDGFAGATKASSASPKALATEQVKKLAVQEIAGDCKITAALVKKLAEANRHELLAVSGGQMDIDLETGMVRTPLGVVTSDAVKKARALLDDMASYVRKSKTDDPRFVEHLQQYLRLVPQKVPGKKGWHTSFINIAAQNQLLDQLETSVELAEQRMKDAATAKTPDAKAQPQVFNVKMSLVEDATVVSKIRRLFESTMSSRHEAGRLKPVRVYQIEIPHMAVAFKSDGEKVGNVKMLWHGTRMFNVLSILKRGFVLPNQLSTVQTTGAMYGPGLYFSAMSTKSLNYSYGYWDGGRRDSNCYMFLVDVAMGKEYIPTYSGNGKKPGYDSCWAKPGQSGVINDEQIVYRTSQANIRYLVEFDER
jgi:poly [ADP-ribose] polymerase